MTRFKIIINADIYPTEDPIKVKTAVNNLFPSLEYHLTPEQGIQRLSTIITCKKGLQKFYSRLREEQIQNAARKILRQSIQQDKIIFYLNKQVAYVNHISFCEPFGESPLGPIRVEIICGDPHSFIDWLTSKVQKRET